VDRNVKSCSASLVVAVFAVAIYFDAEAPSLAAVGTRWDKKACDYFTDVRNAHVCTIQALTEFSPLVNEPAQLISEQAVKKCAWAWRRVYDHDYPFGAPIIADNYGGSVEQFMKSWAAEFTLPLVLESRLPAGNPRPETDVERHAVRIYTEKLLNDCGRVK
jgi:hypothetical protein